MRVAVCVGALVAAGHMVTTMGRGGESRLSAGANVSESSQRAPWVEWRDAEFYLTRSMMDRADPVEVTARFIQNIRYDRFDLALLDAAPRLQEVYTPHTLRRRIGRSRLMTQPEDVRLSEPHFSDDSDSAHIRVMYTLDGRVYVLSAVAVRDADDPEKWSVDRIEGHDRGAPPLLPDDPTIARGDAATVVREMIGALHVGDGLGAYRRLTHRAQEAYGLQAFLNDMENALPSSVLPEDWTLLPEDASEGAALFRAVRPDDNGPGALIELLDTEDGWRVVYVAMGIAPVATDAR